MARVAISNAPITAPRAIVHFAAMAVERYGDLAGTFHDQSLGHRIVGNLSAVDDGEAAQSERSALLVMGSTVPG